MPMKKFRMTNTELKLKRERMAVAFQAGKEALEELKLPYFLAYGSALGCLREGQFQPYEDDINVGIYSWDLAALQRDCGNPTSTERDTRLIRAFDRYGYDPVSEMMENGPPSVDNPGVSMSACPRTFIAEHWISDVAFPILYKFTHRECFVRFDILVFTMQFGQLWDFADGGAETSSGWRYKPFAPQPVEFDKVMTYTMPATALEEHYGAEWHVPKIYGYIDNLSRCENRCQVLRVHPFDVKMEKKELPDPVAWDVFRKEVNKYRMRYAEAMADSPHEFPPKPLDLYKIEAKPMVLFQAAGLCKQEGNDRLQRQNYNGALDKYDEGLYIMDKVKEVLVTWRLVFRQTHNEKAEADRKHRGVKYADLTEPDMPREFRADETEEHSTRLHLLLNAAQAALQGKKWDIVEARTSTAIDLEPKSLKAYYRRGLGRVQANRKNAAAEDFWAMLRVANFESKEALNQLMKILPKEDVVKGYKKLKASADKEHKMGGFIREIEEDERIAIQDERYQRFLADCEQRKYDKQKEVTFDIWVQQYEWRYDADERAKARSIYPECFSSMGAAPLPVEEWEVDYLTHKEVDKIVYTRQTAALGARRRAREGPRPEETKEKEGFVCQLEMDEEDEQTLKEAIIAKGYNYWW